MCCFLILTKLIGGCAIKPLPDGRGFTRKVMNICGFEVGLNHSLFLIAGPCVIESEYLVLDAAQKLADITDELNIPFIFKASFDKANRTSQDSFRGVGLNEGLRILQKVKDDICVPVLTDVHDIDHVEDVADVVDVLQIPAMLCRQTDFIQEVAKHGKPVNVKKGQFLAPWDMMNVVDKMTPYNDQIMVCDRGVSFGYNNLVSDMRSLVIMRDTHCPVIYDATHSVQLPGGAGTVSGGQRVFVPALARAATAVGISGIFMETHQDPDNALSDGPNMVPLHQMHDLLMMLRDVDWVVKGYDL